MIGPRTKIGDPPVLWGGGKLQSPSPKTGYYAGGKLLADPIKANGK